MGEQRVALTAKGKWAAENPDRVCWNCGAINQHASEDCLICGLGYKVDGGYRWCQLPPDHAGACA